VSKPFINRQTPSEHKQLKTRIQKVKKDYQYTSSNKFAGSEEDLCNYKHTVSEQKCMKWNGVSLVIL